RKPFQHFQREGHNYSQEQGCLCLGRVLWYRSPPFCCVACHLRNYATILRKAPVNVIRCFHSGYRSSYHNDHFLVSSPWFLSVYCVKFSFQGMIFREESPLEPY